MGHVEGELKMGFQGLTSFLNCIVLVLFILLAICLLLLRIRWVL